MPPDRPPTIPDHELLRRVGRGGYGEVWLARNIVGSFRAVKIVYRASFESDRPYEREFSGLQKFEPVSRTHPGLVSLLHIGRNAGAGCFYYVMEVADDVAAGQAIEPEAYRPRTLSSEAAQRGRLPLPECVELAVALADALAHLHAQGLVHRDIKPSNIIFVNGRPKLADIGLVTQIGAKATNVGTEGYLAPEGPGSPAADIYSLGKVLYEISMGKSQDQFPELPTRLRELPDAAELMRFNTLVLKACEFQPSKRFHSAEEMRDAFAHLRSPTAAKPGSRSASGLKVVILAAPEAPQDLVLARLLADRLTSDGYSSVLDNQPALNLEWARRIEQQIRSAHAVVALLSPAALASDLIAYALEVAQQASRGHIRAPRLATVCLDLTQPLPRRVAVAIEGAPPASTGSSAEPEEVDNLVQAALSSLLATDRPTAAPPKEKGLGSTLMEVS